MPNGNPDCDRPALDRFFGVIAPVIEAFVQRHHLRLQKYYHESSSWDLLFRHPQGGIAKIEVQREPGETLGIAAIWWYDDFDASTRYIRRSGKKVCILPDPELLVQELQTAFCDLLSWPFGEWDERHGGYTMWKRTWSKANFQDLCKDYPDPLR